MSNLQLTEQGDHFPGKPETVRWFDVRESRGSVGKNSFQS